MAPCPSSARTGCSPTTTGTGDACVSSAARRSRSWTTISRRYALTVDGRLQRADLTRSVVRRGATGPTDDAAVEAPWRSEVRSITGRDVRALDHRAVASSVDRGSMKVWGTQPTGEAFLSWPGAGLELLVKALIA